MSYDNSTITVDGEFSPDNGTNAAIQNAVSTGVLETHVAGKANDTRRKDSPTCVKVSDESQPGTASTVPHTWSPKPQRKPRPQRNRKPPDHVYAVKCRVECEVRFRKAKQDLEAAIKAKSDAWKLREAACKNSSPRENTPEKQKTSSDYTKAHKNANVCKIRCNEAKEKLEVAIYNEIVTDNSFMAALVLLSSLSKTAKWIVQHIYEDRKLNQKSRWMFDALKQIREERSVDFQTITGEALLKNVLDVMTAHRSKRPRKYNWRKPPWTVRGKPIKLLLYVHMITVYGCRCCGDVEYHFDPEIRFPSGEPGHDPRQEGTEWMVGLENEVRLVTFYKGDHTDGRMEIHLMIDGVLYYSCLDTGKQSPISTREGFFHYDAFNGGVRISPPLSFEDRRTPFSEGGFGLAMDKMFDLFPEHKSEIRHLEKKRSEHLDEYYRLKSEMEYYGLSDLLRMHKNDIHKCREVQNNLRMRLEKMEKFLNAPDSPTALLEKYKKMKVKYSDLDHLIRKQISEDSP